MMREDQVGVRGQKARASYRGEATGEGSARHHRTRTVNEMTVGGLNKKTAKNDEKNEEKGMRGMRYESQEIDGNTGTIGLQQKG